MPVTVTEHQPFLSLNQRALRTAAVLRVHHPYASSSKLAEVAEHQSELTKRFGRQLMALMVAIPGGTYLLGKRMPHIKRSSLLLLGYAATLLGIVAATCVSPAMRQVRKLNRELAADSDNNLRQYTETRLA